MAQSSETDGMLDSVGNADVDSYAEPESGDESEHESEKDKDKTKYEDEEVSESEIEANKIINEEFKSWKKHTPYLYDMVMSYALTWPTLTTQWFPDVQDDPDKDVRRHRLLLGTHTEDAPNYVQIAEVEIPKAADATLQEYNEETGEIGGIGAKVRPGAMSFKIVQKIDHDGDVNKARYQPQNPDIIATLCTSGKICIFDRTKHSFEPNGVMEPQMELIGQEAEGFALAWNPHEPNRLASGCGDTTVSLWDLADVHKGLVKPSRRFTHHLNVVGDVQYHPQHPAFVGTVSDDMTFQMLDLRLPHTDKAALVAQGGHTDAVNALAFSEALDYMVVTGSADKTIAIWDMRYIKAKVHSLEGHEDAVTVVQWSPHDPAVLASASYDRRMLVWDLKRIGMEQLPEDVEDGPPEILFMHGGHVNHLSDFCWNPNDPWLMCSAAEDNLIQIWQPSMSIVGDESSIALPVADVQS